MIVYSTIAKLSRHQMICLMLLLVAMLSSCVSEQVETEVPVPPVVEEPDSMSLLLACAPANSTQALTRLSDEVVQLNELNENDKNHPYRHITNVQVYAIKEGAPENVTVGLKEEPVNKDHNYTQFYHFGYCSMPPLTNECLVYAKAEDIPHGNLAVYNGSLNTVNPSEVQSKNDIQFSLEPILDATEARESGDNLATWEIEAWNLANALTAIVNNSHNEGNTLSWETSTNAILKNLFQRFTNNGADLPGSAASVKQWMLSLKEAADSYLTNPPTTIGDDEKALLAIIKAKADEKAATITVSPETLPTLYPRDINLPDGAAALRWTGNKFVPQMQTTTLDDINSVSRFVYPPALYYFVESGIWTSTGKVTFEDYKGKSHWKSTTENDDDAVQPLFPAGGTVMTNTKTVAIADPLQYAVAHLTMEVKADAEYLEYGAGNTKTIPISDLTLKGVIIGGQRSVGYDFKPISNSLYDVNFVYDSQVSGALNTAGDTYHTLVLQSYDGEDVNIILEFEYSPEETTEETTEKTRGFKCLNGYVYPGTRFYLVGVLDPSKGVPPNGLTEEEKAELKKRVFTQDHTNTINMTVKSLEKAYNVLPSLLSSSLEIGVMITPQWISAEPSGPVVLD